MKKETNSLSDLKSGLSLNSSGSEKLSSAKQTRHWRAYEDCLGIMIDKNTSEVYNKCEGRGFMTNKNCHKNRGAAEVFMSSFYLS